MRDIDGDPDYLTAPYEPPSLTVYPSDPTYIGTLLDSRGRDLLDVYRPRIPFGYR